jgi:3'-5' exoribonuclease
MPEVASPSASGYTPVRDLKSEGGGKPFASVLVLRKLTAKTAANGNPFLSLELGDRTGSFSCTVFNDSPVYEEVRGAPEGTVLGVEGKTDSYQGRLSPRLSRAVPLTAEELAAPEVVAQLVESSAEDPAVLWSDALAALEAIVRPELRATVRAVLDELGDAFRNAPAAVSMHHAYRHGLLEHTVHMARAARALLPLYPEVDADLALAGILLHDTGKTIEYEGALATRRSRRGLLQGHVVLGYQLVRRAALKAKLEPELVERLEHIILSHQGELAWGAAALAATPEAVFVSMIDNLDARMGMVQQALRQAAPGEEFSERIAGLGGPLLTRRPPP